MKAIKLCQNIGKFSVVWLSLFGAPKHQEPHTNVEVQMRIPKPPINVKVRGSRRVRRPKSSRLKSEGLNVSVRALNPPPTNC